MGYNSHKCPEYVTWASPCTKPRFIPSAKAQKGTKGDGLRYEKRFAQSFARLVGAAALHGQWFEYVDNGERGWCQPDLIWKRRHSILVFECKLSDVLSARAQLRDLYIPVLSIAYNLPVFGAVVTKNVHREPEPGRIETSLGDALMSAAQGRLPTLHWLGNAPLHLPTYLTPATREPLHAS